MNLNLKQALAQLDPTDDEQWTSDGLPRLDAVSDLVGGNVTRKQVTDAHPGFSRGSSPQPAEPDPSLALLASAEPDGFDRTKDEPAVSAEPAPLPAMKMPMLQVLRSPELIERALHEIEDRCGVLHRTRKETDDELKKLYAHSQALSMHLQRMQKSNPNAGTDEVQRYLKQSQASREKRAAAAQRFIGEGTNAKDIRDQLQVASKLDQAMNRRKPGYGSQRPPVQQPAAG